MSENLVIKLVPDVQGYLTIAQAAERMGMDVQQARAYLRRHNITGVKSGTYAFYSEPDIDNAAAQIAEARASRDARVQESSGPALKVNKAEFADVDAKLDGLLTSFMSHLVDINGAVGILHMSVPYGRALLNKSELPTVEIGGKTFWMTVDVAALATKRRSGGTSDATEELTFSEDGSGDVAEARETEPEPEPATNGSGRRGKRHVAETVEPVTELA